MADDEKQLLTFCTASVDLYARSVVDPSSVSAENIQKDIQSFMSKLDKSRAASVGKVLFCLELQYRNAAMYERFLSTRKKIEDAIEELNKASSIIGEAGENPPSLADLQNHSSQHAVMKTITNDFIKFYIACFPLRHRVRYAPTGLWLSPICTYQTADFEINADNEYVLLEKQQLNWKVQARDKANPGAAGGPEIIVPSIFFFIHWLSDDAESMQRLLVRAREAFAAYTSALAANFRKVLQQSRYRAVFSPEQLKQLDSLVPSLVEDPNKVTNEVLSKLQSDLTDYFHLTTISDSSEPEKPVLAILKTILTAADAQTSIPVTVQDRSKVVFNRKLRLNGQAAKSEEQKLVRIEWKMELVLNKCVTTTETVEIIPKHVDVDRFKQSEQELERKMVIQAVVDPVTDTEISLTDAVQRGIVDYSTGTYNNRESGESMTIDEAIMKGLIQVEFVAVQAGEEKQKNYGVVTVEDPADNSEVHYVVHAAIDRKQNQRLEFEEAVEQHILNLDNGTFWDSLENEAMPIADALDKGYIKGRKVSNLKELQELATSQADIVKSRIKKITATVGILKGLGLRKPAN